MGFEILHKEEDTPKSRNCEEFVSDLRYVFMPSNSSVIGNFATNKNRVYERRSEADRDTENVYAGRK